MRTLNVKVQGPFLNWRYNYTFDIDSLLNVVYNIGNVD